MKSVKVCCHISALGYRETLIIRYIKHKKFIAILIFNISLLVDVLIRVCPVCPFAYRHDRHKLMRWIGSLLCLSISALFFWFWEFDDVVVRGREIGESRQLRAAPRHSLGIQRRRDHGVSGRRGGRRVGGWRRSPHRRVLGVYVRRGIRCWMKSVRCRWRSSSGSSGVVRIIL